jgi:hypothetical protein
MEESDLLGERGAPSERHPILIGSVVKAPRRPPTERLSLGRRKGPGGGKAPPGARLAAGPSPRLPRIFVGSAVPPRRRDPVG